MRTENRKFWERGEREATKDFKKAAESKCDYVLHWTALV